MILDLVAIGSGLRESLKQSMLKRLQCHLKFKQAMIDQGGYNFNLHVFSMFISYFIASRKNYISVKVHMYRIMFSLIKGRQLTISLVVFMLMVV